MDLWQNAIDPPFQQSYTFGMEKPASEHSSRKRPLCDMCKTNAVTVHLTQKIEDKTLKVDLCDNCWDKASSGRPTAEGKP